VADEYADSGHLKVPHRAGSPPPKAPQPRPCLD
jgi:hypothetical protein